MLHSDLIAMFISLVTALRALLFICLLISEGLYFSSSSEEMYLF